MKEYLGVCPKCGAPAFWNHDTEQIEWEVGASCHCDVALDTGEIGDEDESIGN
jgi:hypothetical protein